MIGIATAALGHGLSLLEPAIRGPKRWVILFCASFVVCISVLRLRNLIADSFPLNGIQLQLRPSPEREQAAAELANKHQQAGSAQFHRCLTADQYAEQFAASPEPELEIRTIRQTTSAC